MRYLSTAELIVETNYRLALQDIRGRLTRNIVKLVADMIELSRQPVPECYTQAIGTHAEALEPLDS